MLQMDKTPYTKSCQNFVQRKVINFCFCLLFFPLVLSTMKKKALLHQKTSYSHFGCIIYIKKAC